MRIDKPRVPAARKNAAFVSCLKRPFDRCRHGASLAPDTQRLAVLVLDDDDGIAIAGETFNRLDGQTRSPSAFAQRRTIDVHGDLIVFRTC